MRILTYSFEEALVSIRRSLRSVIGSVVTIAAALLVVGVFLFAWTNLRQLVTLWSNAAEMSIYLNDDIKDADRRAIQQLLQNRQVVSESSYVSKPDALVRFKQEFPDLAALASGAADNPFPASYEVRIQRGGQLAERMSALAGQLNTMPGVSDVRYDRRWLDRLLTAVATVQWVGAVFGAVLILGALLTIANVVRLSFHARRAEIDIMELVGAPSAYVRGPFIAEGVLQGALGAVVALVTLWAGFLFARAKYGDTTAQIFGLRSIQFLPLELSASLLVGGMVLGCLGGLLAARHTRSDRKMMKTDVAASRIR